MKTRNKLPWWIEESPRPDTIKGMAQIVTSVENDMATEVIGGTRTQREYNMGLEEKFLDTLYELYEPGKEFEASYVKMAEKTSTPANIIGNVIQFLEDQNLLTRRFEWRKQENGGGRQAFWTLMTGRDHAANLLHRYHVALAEGKMRRSDVKHKGNPWLNGAENKAKTKATPKQKNQQMELPEPVTPSQERPSEAAMRMASESPEDNLPVETALELVNKCRRYMVATDLINANLNALREAGIEVNEDAYFESVKVKQDPTLAAIALVMPYINSLENK